MHRAKLYYEEVNQSPTAQLWRSFKRDHPAVVGLWFFGWVLFLAIAAPILTPYDPLQQQVDHVLLPPSWDDNGDVHFVFGTDDLGRDLFSRLISGARLTFGLSCLGVISALVIGTIIGAIAGMSTGLKSSFLHHILDITLSIPSLLLAIIIVAILGPSLFNSLAAVVLALLPQFIHTVSSEVHEQQNKNYVVAFRLDGASKFQILLKVILPNIYDKLVVLFTLALSTAILDIAALGFLGLGAQPPEPEWGAMLKASLDLVYVAPWVVAIPGIMLFLTVLSINLVGEGLNKALKERMERL
ncbi:ABC transporter permease subunit [Algicola sagamiensis]|uniref:ABC transporter permease subunit n=1 Tax=Algicola sagamiensis TaxID=163869 RepID=UPI00035FE302|nr:ABC transporter permease subunit [Algicola sagamiensis]